jgi:hypothetical protein
MTDLPQPELSGLLRNYARDLAQVAPGPSLDARIDRLVAAGIENPGGKDRRSRGNHRSFAWAAAAGFAVVTIGAGIVIGVRLERLRDPVAATRAAPGPAGPGYTDLSMWPSDSVAWTIPAEYSPQGTLVAVNPRAKSTGRRYLIDVVVSNDGTMRIERIVPADGESEEHDGVELPIQ